MTPSLGNLRKPLLLAALVCIGLVWLIEAGSALLIENGIEGAPTPGYGIPYLALLDALLLASTILLALPLLVPERIQGRLQGILSLIVSILIIIAGFTGVITVIVLLIVMVSLLFAAPFGTIAYFALYASFNRHDASITLSLIMFLKLAYAVLLVFAHQRFLRIKSLVLLTLTSLVATLIVQILHELVPLFLVSITDAIAGLVNSVLALIWAIVYLVFAVVSLIKVLRIDRALKHAEG